MYTVSQKSLLFVFVITRSDVDPINNICWYCSWENLQPNDIFRSYNVYEYYRIEKQERFVCFRCCHFALPSCQFLAAFQKLLSSRSPQPLF